MLTLDGWWGMEWQSKVKGYNTKWRQGTSKAQKPAWKGYAGYVMAEMKQTQHC